MTERILNDRYALETKVGEGGMAVTYRARDLLLNRTVAVKLMREQFTTDPQFVERFRREAQAAARLSHENIAGVYDTGRANGTYYIVMEFVEGTDLKQRLRQEGPLPVLTALEIGRQTAAALDAAHRGGLVHRDIKPHNILINKEGKAKVTDFGIAKVASESEDTGVIIGSVHYLSPEQARGEATTPSSDLYSLGAVLFEMLTGHTVFEGENAMAVAHKQVYEHPPLPRTLRASIPPVVESMVMRCLEKDPRARYQSAAELQAVLTKLIAQLAQEETIVVPAAAAPAMDATMIYRSPVTKPPATASTAAVAAPKPAVAPAKPVVEEEPRSGGVSGWVIALLFLALAGAVGFGAYKLFFSPPSSGSGSGSVIATKVAVPSLSDLNKQQALDLLARRGLKGEANHESSDAVAEGLVCRQDPAADVQIDPKMTTVLFWVSDGPKSFGMPDVSGMSQDAAKREIRNAGLIQQKDGKEFAKPKSEPSDVAPGMVVRTEPAVGETVDRHGTVTLVLSGGAKKPTYVSETYKPGAAPDLGSETVYVRIEFENPAGSEPQQLWAGTLTPGQEIPAQPFQRKQGDRVIVHMYAGKDEQSVGGQPYAEEQFPPTNAAPSDNAPTPSAPNADTPPANGDGTQ